MHINPVVLVLIEILVVIGLSRLVGAGFRYIRQPLVIGEIVAGIMLGPSLLGWFFPQAMQMLFPVETLPYLNVLSQIGLIFFMFLIGLELNPRYLQGQLRVAILTSNFSIILPFTLGILLALGLYPIVSEPTVSFTAFALFLGAAMSITAFPVLARIITESNLHNSPLGTLALTCAAVDDITAWCLLAMAIAVTRTNNVLAALPTIIFAALYAAGMLTVVRQGLQRLSVYYNRTKRLSQSMLAMIYMGVLVSALITEWIGIHLIFGAFLLGAVMPKNAELTRELALRTEDFILTFLLPIFFAYSGLQTQIGLLNTPVLWLLCAAVLTVAIVGKYVGAYTAARMCGIPQRDATALGLLMNTRGLTELVILNIGLSLKVISPVLFTMLVIMALVTTFMTSPLLAWLYAKAPIPLKPHSETVENAHASNIKVLPAYKLLVPIANPRTQKGLVQLAAAIAAPADPAAIVQSAVVYPLSLMELQEEYAFESMPTEIDRRIANRQQTLKDLVQTIEPPDTRSMIHPIVLVASDVGREVAHIAEVDQMDLVLVGWHRSAFIDNRLGGRVGQILNTAPVDVAVWVEKSRYTGWQTILVPYAGTVHDDLAVELAIRLLVNGDRQLTLLRIALAGQEDGEPDFSYEVRAILNQLPTSVRDRIDTPILKPDNLLQTVVNASQNVELTIAGTNREWGLERQTLGRYTDELVKDCQSSLLITRRYSKVASHMTSLLRALTDKTTPHSSSPG